jgi:hypothetical protein
MGGTQKFSVTPGYSVTLEQAFKSSRRVDPLSRGTELLRPDDDDGLSGALIPVGEGQLSPELSPLRGQGPSEFGKVPGGAEPPRGVEPRTYALRVRRSNRLS